MQTLLDILVQKTKIMNEVMSRVGIQEKNTEGQMMVDFAKRMKMAVVNTFFQKGQEHRVV